jgi:hypothetical protein
MAAAAIVDPDTWLECFDSAFARIAGRFKRVEPRKAARDYLLAVLSDVDTRSCWQLAERAGHVSPHRMQRLLAEAVWDADAVRDDLRAFVVDELGSPDGVLMIDLCRPRDYADVPAGGPRIPWPGGAPRGHAPHSGRHIHSASRNARTWSRGRYRPGVVAAGVSRASARCLIVRSACR